MSSAELHSYLDPEQSHCGNDEMSCPYIRRRWHSFYRSFKKVFDVFSLCTPPVLKVIFQRRLLASKKWDYITWSEPNFTVSCFQYCWHWRILIWLFKISRKRTEKQFNLPCRIAGNLKIHQQKKGRSWPKVSHPEYDMHCIFCLRESMKTASFFQRKTKRWWFIKYSAKRDDRPYKFEAMDSWGTQII